MNIVPKPREPRSRKERIVFITIAVGLAIMAVVLGVSGQWWLAASSRNWAKLNWRASCSSSAR
jgi:hypothetical protein